MVNRSKASIPTQLIVALILLFLWLNPCLAESKERAVDVEGLLQRSGELKLSTKETWLQLLKYGDGQRSSIRSTDFFLSDEGYRSPQSELSATLIAFFSDYEGDPNKNPRCRHPARYFWLANELNLAAPDWPAHHCPALEHWADFPNLESVSVVMVSGYMGNPASTFGHLLVKLNNRAYENSGELLDRGINFGALVPENENPLIYALRGIFGGYEAGFSDKRFYTQDLVYTQLQSRDMWEYVLDLGESEQKLLIFHIWELVGQKYPYYFLRENCAFRSAEVLEIVIDRNLVGSPLWYLPIQLFHNMESPANDAQNRYVREVRFLPSMQRVLYRSFDALSSDEQARVNSFISADPHLDPTDSFRKVGSQQSKINMANFLLDYYQYKAGDNQAILDNSAATQLSALKRYRLTLPADTGVQQKDGDELPRPSLGTKPSKLGYTAIVNDERDYLHGIEYSAVYFDRLGTNSTGNIDGEIVLFDLKAAYDDVEQWAITDFDLLRVENLSVRQTGLTGEKKLSWRFKLGAERSSLACFSCLKPRLLGGVGTAFGRADKAVFYGILQARALWDVGSTLHPGFNLGAIWDVAPAIRMAFDMNSWSLEGFDQFLTTWELQGRFSINRSTQLRFGVMQIEDKEARLSIYKFF